MAEVDPGARQKTTTKKTFLDVCQHKTIQFAGNEPSKMDKCKDVVVSIQNMPQHKKYMKYPVQNLIE